MEYKPLWANETYPAVGLPFFWNEEEKEGYYLVGEDKQKEGKRVFKNNWSGFGGYPEEGETPAKTASRECDEETIGLLAKSAISFENKNAVEIIHGKSHIYVINLYPQNEKDRCYTIEQIYAFSQTFNKLREGELSEQQKEKIQLGWMKASEIAQKIFTYPPHYTIYAEPSSTSTKLDKVAFLRKCQQVFFMDVHNHTENSLECIKNGWSGFEGQVINVQNDGNLRCGNNKSFKRINNNNEKPWNKVPQGNMEVKSNSTPKPWNKASEENLSWRSGNKLEVRSNSTPKPLNKASEENLSWRSGNNFKVQNNSIVKPWHKVPEGTLNCESKKT